MGIGTHKSSTNFQLQVSGISPELVCKVGNLALDGVAKGMYDEGYVEGNILLLYLDVI